MNEEPVTEENAIVSPTPRSTPSPRDKYDEIPEDSHRVGQHRLNFREPVSGVKTIIAAASFVLLLGLFCASALPLLGFNPKVSRQVVSPSGTPSAPASASPSQSSQATQAQAEKVLRQKAVDVYNGTNVPDQATTVAGTLSAKGWTLGVVSEGASTVPARSTVYYDDPQTYRSAQLLAQDLGGALVERSPGLGRGLMVILSSGYAAG